MAPKLMTEFVGTFFLVLTIGLAGTYNPSLAPIAIGSVLMVMVYMGGHVSGAHFNPAVTVAVFIRGKCSASEVIPYWLAQITGALAASGVAYVLTGQPFGPARAANVSAGGAVLAEFVFTFALALVVLCVATTRKTEGNSYYGLAIGFTVLAAAFSAGPISGGAFNPAVGTGPLVWGMLVAGKSASDLWIYLVGPVLGGVGAAMFYQMQHAGDAS